MTIAVWFFSLMVAMWWITDWFALQDLNEAGFNRKEYYYYGFAAVAVAHLTLGVQAWFAAPLALLSDWTGRLLILFCLLMCCFAPMSIVPIQSLVYGCATLFVIGLLWLFWYSNFRVLENVLAMTAGVVYAWLGILLVHHGLQGGFGGDIGGVNRNTTGTAGLAALTCAMFSPYRLVRWTALVLALFFAVVVSSRGSIVAMTSFVAVYFVLYFGITRGLIVAASGAVSAVVAIMLSPKLQELVIEKIFHVHDQARGIGSGFTGRWDMWALGLDAFTRRPVFGWGFRAASLSGSNDIGGVHSGWIKVFVEAGIVGGAVLVAAIAVEMTRRLLLLWKLRKATQAEMPRVDLTRTYRVNAVVAATFCMLCTMWVYDQYYINLGSPVSLVFFMMMTAPTMIDWQGTTSRG
jgi:O-antigen ligase